MSFAKVLRGFEIAKAHFDDPTGHHVGAEHDEVYIYPTDTPLSEAEVAEMKANGWSQHEAKGDDYDPASGWMRHV